ncbi:MAG: phosphoglycerate kinase [Nitrospinota bacterium]|nr:phosphoglycerate kinase [Nitrospinota bacterium]
MKKVVIDQLDLKGKRVFIRVDFNVPLEGGKVADTTRIEQALPTIRHAVYNDAKVIVASHMGRPKGGPDPKASMRQTLDVFKTMLGRPVAFAEDCVGEKAEAAVAALQDGQILLLENLRFHKEEEKNDAEFSQKLAKLADVYVNDAFGTAHRAHCSTVGMTKFVKTCAAGFLMQKEIEYFTKALTNPSRPLAAILGGAKVSSKIYALENLVEKCDIMIIGGGMAFTFLKARGLEIGDNILEPDMIEGAKKVLDKARQRGVKFYMPVDFVVSDNMEEAVKTSLVTFHDLPKGKIAPDIGPASVSLFDTALKGAATIVWNGPMGVFEKKAFAAGTMGLIETLKKSKALTVVGGGDSALAVNMAGAAGDMDFISTGGGAFLELLEGKTLPGLAALPDA